MSNYFYDSFTRVNSSTSPGTADSGDVYADDATLASNGISSNMLYNPNASQSANLYDRGQSDFDITYTLGGTLGLIASANSFISIFRAKASDASLFSAVIGTDGVSFRYYPPGGSAEIVKVVSATITSTSTVRIKADKEVIQVYSDDTYRDQFTIAKNQTATGMGFGFPGSSTARLDSVTTRAVSAQTAAKSQLLTDWRYLLDEPDSTDSYFSDAELLRYGNQELAVIGSKLPIVTREWTITGPGDSNGEFPLPEGMLAVESIAQNNREIPWITAKDRNAVHFPYGVFWRGSPNSPSAYGVWIRGGKIGFSPALTSADSVTVWYRPNLATLANSTDVPDFPAYFEDTLRYGVLQRCALKTQDFDAANGYKALKEQAFREARKAFGESQFKLTSIQVVC